MHQMLLLHSRMMTHIYQKMVACLLGICSYSLRGLESRDTNFVTIALVNTAIRVTGLIIISHYSGSRNVTEAKLIFVRAFVVRLVLALKEHGRIMGRYKWPSLNLHQRLILRGTSLRRLKDLDNRCLKDLHQNFNG